MKNLIQFYKYGLRCEIEHPAEWTGLHSHDEVECVFFLTDQPVRMRIGAEDLTLSRNDTILFWGSIPHQLLSVEPTARQHWFTVPTALFLHWSLPESLRRDILDGRVLIERNEELRAVDLASFPLWKKEYDSKKPDALAPLALSLEARLFRFDGGRAPLLPAPDGSFVEAKDGSSFSLLYDFIVAEYRRPLSVREIARRAGLHENYAITLFKSKYGIGIVEFINMLRVYEAQRLLLTSSSSIIDIALEAGFNSVSNFYRCFRKSCGKNPKEYRKRLSPDAAPALRRRADRKRRPVPS